MKLMRKRKGYLARIVNRVETDSPLRKIKRKGKRTPVLRLTGAKDENRMSFTHRLKVDGIR